MASRNPIVSKPFIDKMAEVLNTDLSTCHRLLIDARAGEPLRIEIHLWGSIDTLGVLQVFEDLEIQIVNDRQR